jgi:hypothetical protein
MKGSAQVSSVDGIISTVADKVQQLSDAFPVCANARE